MDTEVLSNWGYQEFLYYIKKDSTAAYYRSMLPDTTHLGKEKNKYSNPKYADNPITGISERQALAYCQWRSNKVSDNIIHPENLCLPARRDYARFDKSYKVIYRLPTPEELKTVAKMPKKVKRARQFEEMTSETNIVVTNAFTRNAATKPATEPVAWNRTFRCVAYYEKR